MILLATAGYWFGCNRLGVIGLPALQKCTGRLSDSREDHTAAQPGIPQATPYQFPAALAIHTREARQGDNMSTLQFLRMPAVRAALGFNENRSVLAACAKYSISVARRPNAISALGNAPTRVSS